MCKVSKGAIRRLAETARTLALKINEEARKAVEEGKPPEFYLASSESTAPKSLQLQFKVPQQATMCSKRHR